MSNIIELRRKFHRYPETGWLTYYTGTWIADYLEKLGYSVLVGEEILGGAPIMDPPAPEDIEGAGADARQRLKSEGWPEERIDKWLSRQGRRTGILAFLKTGREGKVKAFRFDMDALAVPESHDESRIPVKEKFLSEREGYSHACGHDGHIALGLGLAEYVAKKESKEASPLPETSRDTRQDDSLPEISRDTRQDDSLPEISPDVSEYIFIFQPAEEGVRGAQAFCGNWKYGQIDELYCCHIGFAPEDTFVAGAGGFLATTKFDAIFTGKSAHAGLCPERGRNALLAAAKAVMDMQSFKRPEGGISRLNVGQLRAGEARNAIPAHAWMQLETRGETADLNIYMKENALRCIREAAASYEVACRTELKGESFSAQSSPELTDKIYEIARELGQFKDYMKTKDFGASDDGAVFMNMVQTMGGQAAYMLFGCKTNGLNHETIFDFDEAILEKALNIMKKLA